jgi:lipoic acid synthetase
MPERLPAWFKQRIPDPGSVKEVYGLIEGLELNTICQSAQCPNIGECFSRRTATFLIMGDTCTRNCTFCAVAKGHARPLDAGEPDHIAEAVKQLGLKYVVITSVTRDDLPDGGAAHFARVISRLKESGDALLEVLIPDFKGSAAAVETVVRARPDVINHNVETVPRLYPAVRPLANFEQSLAVLGMVKRFNPGIVTKSGLMVGLGESREEVIETMRALRGVSCDLVTIGQYLQPSARHHPIVRFLSPEEFDDLARAGREIGFRDVASAPLVRSSFRAAQLYRHAIGSDNG